MTGDGRRDATTGPVRVAHLGLGAFHRAHQAWYTQNAQDGSGITAFTGRSPAAAQALADQGFRYTLVARGADGDDSQLITAITDAHDGADMGAWRASLLDAAVLTVTITERAYRIDESTLNGEVARLRAGLGPATAIGRIVSGLAARRMEGLDGLAIVSCDNLRDNAATLRVAVTRLASALDAGLDRWIDRSNVFVSTSVDRITPATDPFEIGAVIDGRPDRCAVVAEPYSAWVLAGTFPSGRPAWERGGALFVDDIEPFERRKLWLLNAGHSLLALRGLALGHRTVAEAVADPALRTELDLLWNDAAEVLPFGDDELTRERAALLERFTNSRIVHRLDQIGRDSEVKLRERVGAVVRERQSRGLDAGTAELAVIGAWVRALQRRLIDGPTPPGDPGDAATWAVRCLVPNAAALSASDECRLTAVIRQGELDG